MTLAFDLFWSFRSPYSYLATPRLIEISQRYDVDVRLRPVYPLAVRVDGFFKRQNPKGPMYTVRD
ncbi:MAG TPA: 2-hydroxychromene-2-carboxylate isomerase, partial [Phenylobacterium sp.]|nr:2-hydroxychromene-2-carboxylate isomerase [Phenylobacterium sp.]